MPLLLSAPKLSFAIPSYNASRWLPYAVESCLWQSEPDIEVVIVNDGSTDATPEIAEAYAKADPRVRVHHQANMGLGAAREIGQGLCRGRFLTWLDADDFLDPDAARDLLGVAERDKVDMVCGNAVVFSDRTYNSRRYFPHPAAARTSFENSRYWKSKVVWRWIFKREFLEAANVVHPRLRLGQDVVIMYDLLCKVGHFSHCPSFFYYFRQEHKGVDTSLEVEIEHQLAHYALVRDVLVRAGRTKPLVKYLSENYMRDVRLIMPRIHGCEPHWERRVLELGLELFSTIDPKWLAKEACGPELSHDAALERLGRALHAGDEEIIRAEFARHGSASGGVSVDKTAGWHHLRRRLKAMFAPLSVKARLRQRALRSLAAERLQGVWSPS